MVYVKQLREVAEGRKTCTQRGVKPGEAAVVEDGAIVAVKTAKGRVKWKVGGVYSVSPGRGKPAAMVSYNTDGSLFGIINQVKPDKRADWLRDPYTFVLRIRLLKIERVHVQDMTESVAVAEGVADVAAYIDLWESINGKTKGWRWADNPDVWRLWFEVA